MLETMHIHHLYHVTFSQRSVRGVNCILCWSFKSHISLLEHSRPGFGCCLKVQTILDAYLPSSRKHLANDALNGFDPAPMSQSPVYATRRTRRLVFAVPPPSPPHKGKIERERSLQSIITVQNRHLMQYQDIRNSIVSIANTATGAISGIACSSVVVSGSLVHFSRYLFATRGWNKKADFLTAYISTQVFQATKKIQGQGTRDPKFDKSHR